ncbi:hypothetical protein DKP76_18280 [Falsochrobactrum shanghaiense]|uniref:Uncharacterized protein n=1 Tax=Falsochrobactrum shanghaiense TaxID=2201899 RepID=A0A316J3M1_9HYPH|nr:hypothetical protein [Falsochrobactrum shanghaiense]PWL16284.1 hypothetical protein DKP76_18280 [Falsochrobactrum shanghaiense]
MRRRAKIGYLSILNNLRYLRALNRWQLSISDRTTAVTLSLANGGSTEGKAFAAFVQFYDDTGQLILPPYQGFDHSPHGIAYFYVSGGEAMTPVVTTRFFTPPPRATTLQIELRSWMFRARARLANDVRVIEDGDVDQTSARPSLHRLFISDRTQAITLSLANGHQGGPKAFVAAVKFFDEKRKPISPPYEGFAKSTRFPAYFYAEGGQIDKPSVINWPFVPPMDATAMEIELYPWQVEEEPHFVFPPTPVSNVLGEPRRRTVAMLRQNNETDTLTVNLTFPPMGSQIAERIDNGQLRIVGIIGEELRNKLGAQIADPALPFDGYDKDWDSIDPSHLIIDTTWLSQAFGWEHALTLRDPAATVEMAIMLEKARAAGICTVLVEPESLHRYPLLSKIASLFDITLKSGDSFPNACY